MPTKAMTLCTQPGCGVLVKGGRCVKHKRTQPTRDYDKRRGSAASRGYGGKWRKARQAFLSRNPLCADHQRRGQLVPATVVDHIVPHRGDMQLFWDQGNWAALCDSCHSRKTAREDGGFGNRGIPLPPGGG